MPDENRHLRSLLLAGAAMALALSSVWAQTVPLHIPAQALAASLTEVARRTGRGVLFTPLSVQGIQAETVDGEFTAEQAVTRLIAGTSLEAVSDESGNIVVRQVTPQRTDTPTSSPAQDVGQEEVETVHVVATRQSADAMQFLAQATINVLSAQDLEHTAVHNVAEALQLLPGINVTNTGNSFFGGIDGASRGEGMFAQVRGMNSEFTLNMINGVDVAQGMPYSREVQLSLLPPSGLQTIVVSKTAQADMQSDFIGGAVDFRTPTAFDFSGERNFSIMIGGRGETRAMDYGKNGLGYSVAAEASQKLGPGNRFGIYAGGYYDIRQYANSEMGELMELTGDNAWAFAVADTAGNNSPGYDPVKNLQSTGFNIGISEGYTTRYGVTVALDWKANSVTLLFARATYANAHTEQNSTLSQILGTGVRTGSMGAAIGTAGPYQPHITSISTRLWYETNPEDAGLGTAQIGGETRLSRALTLSGRVFCSWGNNDRPDHIEISARPSGDFAYGGTTILSYGADHFPVPILTDAMRDRLGNVGDNAARRGGQLTIQHSGQDKLGTTFDALYTIGGAVLESVKSGFKYEMSWRAIDNTDWTNAVYTDGTLFSSLGLYSGRWAEVFPGKYTWPVPKIDQGALFKLFYLKQTPASSDSCATPALLGICNAQTGREAVTSAYMMATLHWGNVEAITGLRYEHTAIRNGFWLDEYDRNGRWLSGAATSSKTVYDEFLPSLFLNWRPSENDVYRVSVWTSYTRPAFVQLANNASVYKSDTFDVVTMGNPNLKPVEAVNFDASGQWINDASGYAQITAFAKLLSNYLYNSGTNFVNVDTVTYVKQPENGGAGHVLGVEIEFRQKLSMLGDTFSGFGIGGNYTRNWTKVDLGAHTNRHDEVIQNAPGNMANLQIFYEDGRFQADVLWHYSGAYMSRYDALGLGARWDDEWIQPMQRVDLHLGYDFANGLCVDGSVSNLMDSYSYWSHVGKDSLAISDVVDTGRTILVTLKYKS